MRSFVMRVSCDAGEQPQQDQGATDCEEGLPTPEVGSASIP
jgi:hypothetical protein